MQRQRQDMGNMDQYREDSTIDQDEWTAFVAIRFIEILG